MSIIGRHKSSILWVQFIIKRLHSIGLFLDVYSTIILLRGKSLIYTKYLSQKKIEYYDSSENVVVNAESVLVRAFLEKDFLGREKERREPEPEQQVTEDRTYRCNIDSETKKAVLVKYLGKENRITLPDVVKINGQEYLVGGTEQNIFMDTPVNEVEINAEHWKEIYNPVHLCVLPEQFPKITWLNLNKEQEKQLEENRERAEQHMGQETKEERKEFEPIEKKKSVGMDI